MEEIGGGGFYPRMGTNSVPGEADPAGYTNSHFPRATALVSRRGHAASCWLRPPGIVQKALLYRNLAPLGVVEIPCLGTGRSPVFWALLF